MAYSQSVNYQGSLLKLQAKLILLKFNPKLLKRYRFHDPFIYDIFSQSDQDIPTKICVRVFFPSTYN